MPTSGGLAIWLGVVLPLLAGQIVLLGLAGTLIPSEDRRTSQEGQTEEIQEQGPELVLGESTLRASSPQVFSFLAKHIPGILHQSIRLWELLAGGTVLMLLGLADDRWGLDWKLRIGVQTLVAIALVCLGWRASLFIDMPWLTGAISVLWIVGLVNSFNMLDNMDGLSAGVAAIAAVLFAVVMLLTPRPDNNQPQLFVAGLLFVVAGSLIGFLWHNRPPARLFMGDAGSYWIGYLLATTTLTATFAGGHLPKHAVFAPLCVLAVPLYDTASVVLIRLREGRSPFVGDKSHFSHRLVELGMSKPQAVLTIYLTTATCGLGALLLHEVSLAGALIILLMVVCILALVAVLETAGRRGR